MRNAELISVIIPVYNAQKYLEQCLASVLASTWRALEIICVNDGSTDGSEQILLAFAEKDPRIVLLNQPNSGVSAARNAGLEQATGDCIAFIDADDFVAPDYFSSLADGIAQSDAEIAVCGAFKGVDSFLDEARRDYCADERPLYTDSSDRVLSDPYLLNYIWGRLYTASCLNGVRFPVSLSLGEDTAFNIQIYARRDAPTVIHSPKKMYFYRIGNPDSLTNFDDNARIILRAEWCLSQYDELDDRAKTIYLDIAFKSLWAYRYLTRFSGGDRQKIKTVCKQCRENAKTLSLNGKTRLKYRVFTSVPSLYRLFRLLTDPTLFQWEKEQRKNARKKGETYE